MNPFAGLTGSAAPGCKSPPLGGLLADGGAGGAVPAVTPASVTLPGGGTQQYATTGFTGGTVTWSVPPDGSSITVGGLFTAPNNPGDETITATGVANPAQVATAVAHVYGITPGSGGTLNTGTTQQFTATNFTDVTVTWSAVRGSVSGGGLYTAPGTTGADTITATGVANPAQTASSTLTVTSPVILFDNFTSVASGADLNTDTAVTWTRGTNVNVTGTFLADANHAVYANSGAIAWYAAKSNQPPTPDYTVTATFTYLSFADAPAIIARGGDPAGATAQLNGYGIRWRAFHGIELIRYDDLAATLLATINANDPVGNYTLELQVSATSIKGTISGSLTGTATVVDATYAAAGYIGLIDTSSATPTTGAHCSSITVQ